MANQINDCKFNFYTNALAKRQAPNFNGVSQYSTSLISLADQDLTFSFHFKSNSSAQLDKKIVSFVNDNLILNIGTGTSGSGRLRVFIRNTDVGQNLIVDTPDGTIIEGQLNTATVSITKGGNFSLTINGDIYDRVFTFPVDLSLIRVTIGNEFGLNSYFSGLVFNVKINDGAAYNYPMDDGWANNPVMRNTGTGSDGTFINMTEAAWIEIDA